MRARVALAAVAATLAVALPSPAGACACGIAPQARIDVERALVVFADGREDLVISYDLRAAGKRPAVVLPVPREPKVTALAGDPFAWLERVTAPRMAAGGSDGSDGAGVGAGTPTTIKRSIVGGYSVTRLHGGSGATLDRWLRRNGYALPAGAAPILHSYARRGWWFVALRLATRADGALKPLRLRFKADRPVYPMRLAQLGKRPVQLELYAVSDTVVAATPLAQGFSGPVKDLREPPPPSLQALIDPAATLTKLQARALAPAVFRSDLVLRAVPSVWAGLAAVVARLA
jgi:hypothetical protein